jgi:hypothetical protein
MTAEQRELERLRLLLARIAEKEPVERLDSTCIYCDSAMGHEPDCAWRAAKAEVNREPRDHARRRAIYDEILGREGSADQQERYGCDSPDCSDCNA